MPPATAILLSARRLRGLVGLLLIGAPMLAWGQDGACSSDGQPRPLALLERFVNADCADCWTDPATPKAGVRAVAIDWIVPGSRGEDAPLAALATRDGLARLKALQREVPARSDAQQSRLLAAARTLRVAHGPPIDGHVGVSIELKPAGKGPWRAWLALVERVPSGSEGTPVTRHLVRSLVQPAWDLRRLPSRAEQKRLFDARTMRIPAGADPERLMVVGWVQDARGRIRAIAQSQCTPVAPSQ